MLINGIMLTMTTKSLKTDYIYVMVKWQLSSMLNASWIIIILNLQCFTKHGRRRQQHGLQPNVKFTV